MLFDWVATENVIEKRGGMSRLRIAALVLTLAAAGCAADDASQTGTDERFAAVVAPDGASPYTIVDEPVAVHALDKAYFGSLAEMYAAAPLIVVGTVREIELGKVLSQGAPAGEDSFLQQALFHVDVSETLKGKPTTEATVVHEAFIVSGDELRPAALEGIVAADVGDEVVWFLEPSHVAGPDLWSFVSFDGDLRVVDGAIASDLDRDGGVASSVRGAELRELVSELRRCGERAECGQQWRASP